MRPEKIELAYLKRIKQLLIQQPKVKRFAQEKCISKAFPSNLSPLCEKSLLQAH
jgi:hypothetical protein